MHQPLTPNSPHTPQGQTRDTIGTTDTTGTIDSATHEQPQGKQGEEQKARRTSLQPISNKVIGKLGKGSFGEVFLTTTEDGELHALKVLSKKKMALMNSKHNAINEVNVLRTLDHPYIAKIHGVFQTTQDLHILMDYCEGIQHDQEASCICT